MSAVKANAMEYWFYHLEHTSLEAALPTLLEKSLANDWRVRIQFADAQAISKMDRYLWSYKDDSFLPHGRDDQPGAGDHPILLTLQASEATEDVVFLIGSAQPSALTGVKRCITMVDSRDEAGRAIARERWANAKKQEANVSYWKQNDHGKWVKQG